MENIRTLLTGVIGAGFLEAGEIVQPVLEQATNTNIPQVFQVTMQLVIAFATLFKLIFPRGLKRNNKEETKE